MTPTGKSISISRFRRFSMNRWLKNIYCVIMLVCLFDRTKSRVVNDKPKKPVLLQFHKRVCFATLIKKSQKVFIKRIQSINQYK